MSRDGGVLDGFHVGWVPEGTGDAVSDFASEWEDVQFTTRVWERQTADGYRVDLRVHVLRGERLTDLDALRTFLAEYHERDLALWHLTDFPHDDGPGLLGEAQAFWLPAPGAAVNVLVDPERFDAVTLQTVARAVTPQRESERMSDTR
ncbi:hypothetical protein [Micromonospora endophytica]|uniref:Uncharacterized protein n=1 Tax=Micromonospora endophytica TaxID=515350 RepID=A0A2W2CPP7_9ACTN|nr:hypothetical protein [Micromonospora endophytica]PZF90077.1 hypothetical protein C1I93_23215 [Micromonospora endophytica]RIW41600.1 hypothetical protein D3H59_25675 [Micromonospora endophytica]